MSPLQGRWRGRFELIEFLRRMRDIRAALRGLKAQQVRSPGQRPGLTYVPHLRPVRAKVINNRLPILLPLQGEGLYTLVPRALPWAGNWLPFQGARGEGCGGPARAESPTSSEPRATPWVNVRTTPAPCKGKSNKQPFAHTFALTGRRALYPGTQGVALGWGLAALSGRSRRNSSLFPQRGHEIR